MRRIGIVLIVIVVGVSWTGLELAPALAGEAAAEPAVRWSRSEPLGASGEVGGLAVAADGATVFVSGRRTAGRDFVASVIAYEAATGLERWSRDAADPGSTASVLAVSLAGDAVFAGGSATGEGGINTDYLTFRRRVGNGALDWSRAYFGPLSFNPDFVTAIATAPDDARVYVTGWSKGPGILGWDWATVAYDAVDGDELWSARRNGSPSSGSRDVANALAVAPSGDRVVVAGRVEGAGRGRYTVTSHVASTGATAWSVSQTGLGDGEARALAIGPAAGRVFVTGSVGGGDLLVTAHDPADGSEIWSVRRDGGMTGFDEGRALELSIDGGTVFVAAVVDGPGATAAVKVFAFDTATGAERWATTLGGDGAGRRHGVAVAPDGARMFVGATFVDGVEARSGLFVMDGATGDVAAQVWLAPAPSEFAGFAVSPEGRLVYAASQVGDALVTTAVDLEPGLRIDVAPDRDPNVLDLDQDVHVRVAVLGDAGFDVRTLNPATFRFGPAQAAPPAEWVGSVVGGDELVGTLPDVNGDGYEDWVVPFVLAETGLTCADLRATLTVSTFEGVPLRGSDDVVPRPCDGS